MNKKRQKHIEEIYRVFTKMETPIEAKKFMTDILTPNEIESIAERWQIMKELDTGMVQREVSAKLSVSIAKVTRGSRILKYGEGGFLTIMRKMKKD